MNYVDVPKRWVDWDGSQPMKDLAKLKRPGEQESTAGIAQYIKELCKLNSPANGGFRHYQNLSTLYYDDLQTKTVESSAGKVSLQCIWPEGWNTEARYNNGAARNGALGRHTSALISALETYPIGRKRVVGKPVRLRLALLHEADNKDYNKVLPDGQRALEPAAYVAYVQHLVRVGVDWALSNDVTPDEFAIGGLLTAVGMENGEWPWYEGFEKWVLESGFPMGFYDKYFKAILYDEGTHTHTTPVTGTDNQLYVHEPVIRVLEKYHRLFEANGIFRFALAETAFGWDTRANPDILVARQTHHLRWLKELQDYHLARRGFEIVAPFHKELGPMSMHGAVTIPGREEVARQTGWHQIPLNRTA